MANVLLDVLMLRSCRPARTGLLLGKLAESRFDDGWDGSSIAGCDTGTGSASEETGKRSFLRWLTTSSKEYEVPSATHARSPRRCMAPTPPSSISLSFRASSPMRINRSLCFKDMTITDPLLPESCSSNSSFLSSPPTHVHPACLIFPPNAGLSSGSV